MSRETVEDKYRRVYENQSKSERLETLRDYEEIVSDPKHPWRTLFYKRWSEDDLALMVQLLRESLQ